VAVEEADADVDVDQNAEIAREMAESRQEDPNEPHAVPLLESLDATSQARFKSQTLGMSALKFAYVKSWSYEW